MKLSCLLSLFGDDGLKDEEDEEEEVSAVQHLLWIPAKPQEQIQGPKKVFLL